jgi:hypothetical protein
MEAAGGGEAPVGRNAEEITPHPQAQSDQTNAAKPDVSGLVFVDGVTKLDSVFPMNKAPDVAIVSGKRAASSGEKEEASQTPKGPPLIVKLGIASLGISTLFYVLLFIYLGASSNQTAYTQNLNIAVGIYDVGQIGAAFQGFASNVPAGNGLPNLQVTATSWASAVII